jgi:O-antigen/teichoic acid export membrane protein
MSSIAFPAFSRVQGDLEKMSAVYYSTVVSSTAITIPCFVLLILLSEQLVPAVFGEQWRGSGPVLQYLMIVACISSITFFNSSLLLALGRARANFKLGLLNTSLNIIAFLIAVRWGIVAVAAAFAIRAIVTFPVSMYVLKRYTSISFANLIVRMKGHCAGLLCLFLAVTIAGDRTNDLSVWLRLLVQINSGVIAYIATLYLFDRALCKRLFSLVIVATKRS